MVKRDSDIQRLRAEVAAKHRAATNKISRLRKQGIEVGGSEYDIRRESARVKRYNRAQLNAYLNDLQNFTSRRTQFVGLSEGQPATTQDWAKYKALEQKYRAIGDSHLNAIGDTFIPTSGRTIAEREEEIRPNRLRSIDNSVNRPYVPIDRKPENINGPKALRELTKQMQQRVSKKYLPAKIRQTKANFADMLNLIGADELMAKIDKLTLHQADVLFNYTNAANAIATMYSNTKKAYDGSKGRYLGSVSADQSADAEKLIDWALKEIPRTKKK